MKTIWNYELPTADKEHRAAVKYTAKIPIQAKVLHILVKPVFDEEAGKEVEKLFAYVAVDTDNRLIDHTFFVAGTGYDCAVFAGEPARYVGTARTSDDWVWHVFHNAYGR